MEEKQYEYKGTVTISTEEYRDLVKGVFAAEKNADDYRSRYWEEQSKTKELTSKVEAQEKALAHYRNFVNSKEDITLEYKMYLRQLGEE
jgi:hypothetical protein